MQQLLSLCVPTTEAHSLEPVPRQQEKPPQWKARNEEAALAHRELGRSKTSGNTEKKKCFKINKLVKSLARVIKKKINYAFCIHLQN